ncbi:hypothetical protein GQX73_g6771 [Xylaria multiplex]|uniref:GH16 domain-containing protein n=1 Tax=Xylaria multiplex TaxID=323545 RepID=A0A7C8MRD3_9PEZI|nr:hypothetical protein GQX73_g6771 [Xylaria multiplex]
MFAKLLAFALTVTSVAAEAVPGYSGYNVIWQENFNGAAGSLVNEGNWNIIERSASQNSNNEWQTYTRSNLNHQLSGGATLQIVPLNNGGWTSARLESKYVFTPPDGRRTMVEAKIRFGANGPAQKQGIWPAFWMLGDSIRHGTGWPACGEVDILEMVNGVLTGYGTVHCDVAPGGICNEFSGIGGNIGNVWNSLATTPLYIILNVAVGGDWPGAPNANTLGSWGSEMEVAYVAQYQSA